MAGFIEGDDRGQSTLFPERLEDWVAEDHLVRVVDLFVEEALAANRSFNLVRAVGRGLVIGMAVFLKVLSVVGTAAMIWVGGGIIVQGLEGYGLGAIAHAIERLAEAASHDVPAAVDAVRWLVTAIASGLVGLLAGLLLIPVVGKAIAPLWSKMTAVWSDRTTGSPVRDGRSTPRRDMVRHRPRACPGRTSATCTLSVVSILARRWSECQSARCSA